jgi:hypothetical protein
MEAILPLSGKKSGSVSLHRSARSLGREVGDDVRRRTREQQVTRITNPKVVAATNSGKKGRSVPVAQHLEGTTDDHDLPARQRVAADVLSQRRRS